jgi:hypothetical protein
MASWNKRIYVLKQKQQQKLERVNYWEIMPCSPLKINRRFAGTFRHHLQSFVCCLFFVLVSPKCRLIFIALHGVRLYPKRQNSSQPPLWEPHITQRKTYLILGPRPSPFINQFLFLRVWSENIYNWKSWYLISNFLSYSSSFHSENTLLHISIDLLHWSE